MTENHPNTQFKASAYWCYRFMKRNKLSIRRRTTMAQRMPHDYDDKLLEYQRYIIRLHERHGYSLNSTANADQTPITFDLPSSQTIAPIGVRSVTIKSTGNFKKSFYGYALCIWRWH